MTRPIPIRQALGFAAAAALAGSGVGGTDGTGGGCPIVVTPRFTG